MGRLIDLWISKPFRPVQLPAACDEIQVGGVQEDETGSITG